MAKAEDKAKAEKDQTQTQEAETPTTTEDTTPSTEETPAEEPRDPEEVFREEQAAKARRQNLRGDNAVPEQRPQAFAERPGKPSALTQRLREEGAISDEKPMGKEAYDRAQNNAGTKQHPVRKRAAHIGTVVEVLSGPHAGRWGAVLRVVSYESLSDRLRKNAGTEDSDYIPPKEVEVAFRGDERDGERLILDLTEVDYNVHSDGAFSGRAFVSGAI